MSDVTPEPPARILVVDDDFAILRTITRYLRDYAIDVADTIEAALGHVATTEYDLLLLDLRLPDGLSDVIIRDVRGRRSSVPIIVMSGDLDPQLLARAGQGGADDFIEKPFVREALLVKIERHLTAYRLRTQAARQRAEIDELHAKLDREIEVACTIFDRMGMRGEFPAGEVRQLVLPFERLAGDFVFATHTSTGRYRWMLGDVTGHTLSSALVTLSLASLFYGPGRELPEMADLIAAMDRELIAMLPANMFCVAAMCELDRATGALAVWNGGSPDLLLRRAAGEVVAIAAGGPPLAAERYAPPSHPIVHHRVERGDRVVAFSDGLVELRNHAGELIGPERLRALVAEAPGSDAFDRLLGSITGWAGPGGAYDDDLSIIEVAV